MTRKSREKFNGRGILRPPGRPAGEGEAILSRAQRRAWLAWFTEMDRRYRPTVGALLNGNEARFKDVPRLGRLISWGRMLKNASELLKGLPPDVALMEWRLLEALHPELVCAPALSGGAGYRARLRSAEKALGFTAVPPFAISECDIGDVAGFLAREVCRCKQGVLNAAQLERRLIEVLAKYREPALAALVTALSSPTPMPAAIARNMTGSLLDEP